MLFATCSSVSSSTGIGSTCSINIAYNKQLPLCTSASASNFVNGKRICRPPGDLCTADPDFRFDLHESPDNDVCACSLPATPFTSTDRAAGFRPRASIRHLPANKGVFSPARSPSYGHDAGPPGSGSHQVRRYKSGRVPRPACDCRDRERVAPTAHAELGDVCSMRQGRGGLCWERERKERLAGR